MITLTLVFLKIYCLVLRLSDFNFSHLSLCSFPWSQESLEGGTRNHSRTGAACAKANTRCARVCFTLKYILISGFLSIVDFQPQPIVDSLICGLAYIWSTWSRPQVPDKRGIIFLFTSTVFCVRSGIF